MSIAAALLVATPPWPCTVAVPPPSCSRRRGLLLPLAASEALGALPLAQPASADAPAAAWEATVGAGEGAPPGSSSFASIGAALVAAPKGAVAVALTLRPGTYREQVIIESVVPVTLDVQPPGAATVVWETERPYEAALAVQPGARATVRGLRIRHAGKSVANNYAVSSQGGELEMQDCDVSSTTGAGVAAEGGRLSLRGGSVHDCARQGLVLFGPMVGFEPLRVIVSGTSLRGNGNYLGDGDAIRGPFDGILARNGVEAELRDVAIEGSGAAGLAVYEDSRVTLEGGALKGNRQGDTRTKNGGEIIRTAASR